METKTVTIENKNFKAEISTFGAEIHHFVRKADGAELIWNGDTSVWKNHAPILFPFVARCLGGYFVIEGKKCEYTRNHGFARDLNTQVVLQEPSKVVFQLTQSEDTLYRFPYNFTLLTEYELTDNGLNWKLTVKNTDTKPFKFGIGTHTAFACPRNTDAAGTTISDYEVVFEKKEPLISAVCNADGYLAGYGKQTKVYGEKDAGVIPLNDKGFGNGHLFTNYKSQWVGLRNKKDGSILSISTKGFPYCMIWQNTAGAPQFVCIEPWHGIPDHEETTHNWDDKLGMNEVKPGESFESIQNIAFVTKR